jgi:hypothetical protein
MKDGVSLYFFFSDLQTRRISFDLIIKILFGNAQFHLIQLPMTLREILQNGVENQDGMFFLLFFYGLQHSHFFTDLDINIFFGKVQLHL